MRSIERRLLISLPFLQRVGLGHSTTHILRIGGTSAPRLQGANSGRAGQASPATTVMGLSTFDGFLEDELLASLIPILEAKKCKRIALKGALGALLRHLPKIPAALPSQRRARQGTINTRR